jgi:hypothetical protein
VGPEHCPGEGREVVGIVEIRRSLTIGGKPVNLIGEFRRDPAMGGELFRAALQVFLVDVLLTRDAQIELLVLLAKLVDVLFHSVQVDPERCARDLPERAPRSSSCRPTASYVTPRLSWGNTVLGRPCRGVVRWVPCVRIAEVRGSNPLSSTSRNAP